MLSARCATAEGSSGDISFGFVDKGSSCSCGTIFKRCFSIIRWRKFPMLCTHLRTSHTETIPLLTHLLPYDACHICVTTAAICSVSCCIVPFYTYGGLGDCNAILQQNATKRNTRFGQLKIVVSAVRFRPSAPPFLLYSKQNSSGTFCWRRSLLRIVPAIASKAGDAIHSMHAVVGLAILSHIPWNVGA